MYIKIQILILSIRNHWKIFFQSAFFLQNPLTNDNLLPGQTAQLLFFTGAPPLHHATVLQPRPRHRLWTTASPYLAAFRFLTPRWPES
jgi:hypothetical protein